MSQTLHVPPGFRHELTLRLGRERVFTHADDLAVYAQDDTPRAIMPGAVVFPRDTDELAAVVRAAYRHGVPVVPRGAGSGNVGGALPVPGALVVAFECMNALGALDPVNRTLRVQPGVTNQQVQQAAAAHGLFWPPDPGSSPYCQVGGNLAMNAAGPGAVKRGVTRDWVLGLEAVTGTGDVIRVGTQTSKGVVGYDLTRLLVGSEGTLALTAEATLRLWPRPAAKRTARICFDSTANALAAVQRVMASGGTPSALEFMDGLAIDALARHGYDAGLPAGTGALLMLEADGSEGEVAEAFPQLLDAVQGTGLVALDTGAEPGEIAELWRARKSLSRAVKQIAPLKINEDVVVPVTRLPDTVAGIEALAAEFGVPVVNFGHAGNGNLHVNLMVHPDDAEEVDRARACLRRIFALVLEHGGTLSGEHGVGTEKAPFVAEELGQSERALHRAIKADFDPAGILNPGKGF